MTDPTDAANQASHSADVECGISLAASICEGSVLSDTRKPCGRCRKCHDQGVVKSPDTVTIPRDLANELFSLLSGATFVTGVVYANAGDERDHAKRKQAEVGLAKLKELM